MGIVSFQNDDKTICELFYVCCDDIQDMELSTALRQLLAIFANGLKNHTITMTSEVKSQLINWFVSQPAFIQALCPDFEWEVLVFYFYIFPAQHLADPYSEELLLK